MVRIFFSLFFCFFYLTLFAQQVYFADGYHGGIYGHYPVEWKTKFIIDNFQKYPEWKISMEIEPETWDTVKLKTPEDYRNLQKIVGDSRVEFTNPTYSQPYCYNISGESLIRQFAYGIKKTNLHFPNIKFTTYSVEEPCFTSSLPQILKLFGYNYAVLKNPNTCWGGYTTAYGGELVNWIGPDGTSILTVPRYECEEFENNSTWQTKAWINSSSYLKACFDYGIKNPAGMCFQDAGWKNGPWLGVGDSIGRNSIYITWKDYIENISIGKTDDDWHFSQEDVLVNLMWGSQVLQRIGQQVRKAENNILIAEKIGTLAYLENRHKYNQETLDEAWRTLMLAQHHDSWIVPYNKLVKQRTWADEIETWTEKTNTISKDIIEKATSSFRSSSESSFSNGFIRIYNTLGVSRNENVSVNIPIDANEGEFTLLDSKKKEIPFVIVEENGFRTINFKANVPSFGYATYMLKSGKPKSFKRSNNLKQNSNNFHVIENDTYRIVFDLQKGGTINSLIAKKEGNREYVTKNSDYLLGEIRGFFYEEGKFNSSKDNPARLTVLNNNYLETSVLIEGEIASHPFQQVVTIKQNQRLIDFNLRINWRNNVGIGEYKQQRNWQENRRAFTNDKYKLSVLFPVNLNSPKLYKNAPFDVCESRLENTFFDTWDQIKHNVILNWVDLSEGTNGKGFTLLSDHTTSYSFGDGHPLGLTVQYSGVGLWGRNYNITKPTEINFAIVPHSKKWDESSISEESACWNEPLVATYSKNIELINNSLIDVSNSGYEISSVLIGNNGVLLRLFNVNGDESIQKIRLDFPHSSIKEVDLNGNVINSVKRNRNSNNNEFQLSMPRFGLKTYLVEM